MIFPSEGLYRGEVCSRFSKLKPISTNSRLALTTISTESAYRIRCVRPADLPPRTGPDNMLELGRRKGERSILREKRVGLRFFESVL